jgi:hypothetical protein
MTKVELIEEVSYDPAHFNDRLLLGLRVTLGEAELHVLRARLQVESGTRFGAEICLSRQRMGFVYNADGKLVMGPTDKFNNSEDRPLIGKPSRLCRLRP